MPSPPWWPVPQNCGSNNPLVPSVAFVMNLIPPVREVSAQPGTLTCRTPHLEVNSSLAILSVSQLDRGCGQEEIGILSSSPSPSAAVGTGRRISSVWGKALTQRQPHPPSRLSNARPWDTFFQVKMSSSLIFPSRTSHSSGTERPWRGWVADKGLVASAGSSRGFRPLEELVVFGSYLREIQKQKTKSNSLILQIMQGSQALCGKWAPKGNPLDTLSSNAQGIPGHLLTVGSKIWETRRCWCRWGQAEWITTCWTLSVPGSTDSCAVTMLFTGYMLTHASWENPVTDMDASLSLLILRTHLITCGNKPLDSSQLTCWRKAWGCSPS